MIIAAKESDKSTVEVTVKEDIYSTNSKELENSLLGLFNQGYSKFIIDLTAVEYFSTAGLRVLVSLLNSCKTKKENGDVTLKIATEGLVSNLIEKIRNDADFTIQLVTQASLGLSETT